MFGLSKRERRIKSLKKNSGKMRSDNKYRREAMQELLDDGFLIDDIIDMLIIIGLTMDIFQEDVDFFTEQHMVNDPIANEVDMLNSVEVEEEPVGSETVASHASAPIPNAGSTQHDSSAVTVQDTTERHSSSACSSGYSDCDGSGDSFDDSGDDD